MAWRDIVPVVNHANSSSAHPSVRGESRVSRRVDEMYTVNVNTFKIVACRREIHRLCSIDQFHSEVSAIYCLASPSFRRRGHILQKG
jgi:hypothetical protein